MPIFAHSRVLHQFCAGIREFKMRALQKLGRKFWLRDNRFDAIYTKKVNRVNQKYGSLYIDIYHPFHKSLPKASAFVKWI